MRGAVVLLGSGGGGLLAALLLLLLGLDRFLGLGVLLLLEAAEGRARRGGHRRAGHGRGASSVRVAELEDRAIAHGYAGGRGGHSGLRVLLRRRDTLLCVLLRFDCGRRLLLGLLASAHTRIAATRARLIQSVTVRGGTSRTSLLLLLLLLGLFIVLLGRRRFLLLLGCALLDAFLDLNNGLLFHFLCGGLFLRILEASRCLRSDLLAVLDSIGGLDARVVVRLAQIVVCRGDRVQIRGVVCRVGGGGGGGGVHHGAGQASRGVTGRGGHRLGRRLQQDLEIVEGASPTNRVTRRDLLGQTVVDRVGQALQAELGAQQGLLIARLDGALDLAHEVAHAQVSQVAHGYLTLVGQLDVPDGAVVQLAEQLDKLLGRAEFQIELENDELDKEQLALRLEHSFLVVVVGGAARLVAVLARGCCVKRMRRGMWDWFGGGETSQLRVVERVEIAEQTQQCDLGARVDLAALLELVHDELEAGQALDLNGRLDVVVERLFEPVVQRALHGYQRLRVI